MKRYISVGKGGEEEGSDQQITRMFNRPVSIRNNFVRKRNQFQQCLGKRLSVHNGSELSTSLETREKLGPVYLAQRLLGSLRPTHRSGVGQFFPLSPVTVPKSLWNLKGLCHGCLTQFVNIANYAFLSAEELNVNEEITSERQNHSFLSYKYASLA